MRIATLANASVIHTQRWVAWFRSRGHDVRLWSLEPGPPALDAQPLPRAPLPGALRYPLAVPALRRALRSFRPDLIDAHFVPNYGVMGALSGCRPLVVTAWGSDLLVTALAHPLQTWRARAVLTRAALVIADAENLAAAARRLGGDGRVRCVPWGIDLERFRAGAGGVAREPGLLLSTRMHEPVYDLDTVLRAAREILAADPATRLAIAGTGSLTAALERRAAELLPTGRYEFLGRLDPAAMASWLARAEIAISASHSDSTSVSLLETMASGAIPVLSDIEGHRGWVAEGDGARLFPPGDAQALAAAVRRVRADPAWSEAARRRNRARVERDADANRNMATIEAAFAAVARRA